MISNYEYTIFYFKRGGGPSTRPLLLCGRRGAPVFGIAFSLRGLALKHDSREIHHERA